MELMDSGMILLYYHSFTNKCIAFHSEEGVIDRGAKIMGQVGYLLRQEYEIAMSRRLLSGRACTLRHASVERLWVQIPLSPHAALLYHR